MIQPTWVWIVWALLSRFICPRHLLRSSSDQGLAVNQAPHVTAIPVLWIEPVQLWYCAGRQHSSSGRGPASGLRCSLWNSAQLGSHVDCAALILWRPAAQQQLPGAGLWPSLQPLAQRTARQSCRLCSSDTATAGSTAAAAGGRPLAFAAASRTAHSSAVTLTHGH